MARSGRVAREIAGRSSVAQGLRALAAARRKAGDKEGADRLMEAAKNLNAANNIWRRSKLR